MDLLRAYSPPLDLPPWWPYIFAARTWNTEKERRRRGRRGEAFGLIRISRGYLKVGQNRIYSRHCDTFSPIRSSLFLFFFLFFLFLSSTLLFPFPLSLHRAPKTRIIDPVGSSYTRSAPHRPESSGNESCVVDINFFRPFLPSLLRVRRRLISRV